jgi:hypothetical protein
MADNFIRKITPFNGTVCNENNHQQTNQFPMLNTEKWLMQSSKPSVIGERNASLL